MIFDTDVLIWAFRGNARAAKIIDSEAVRVVSAVCYMELLQGARDRRELAQIRSFLKQLGFGVVPLTEEISNRASVYMEEYTLASGLGTADALVAATAVELGDTLLSGNHKHFRAIKELSIQRFRPI